MFEYKKLFADGNVICIKNIKTNEKFIHSRKSSVYWDNICKDCMNPNLSYEHYEIQYIIRLDENGNMIEKLFDRAKDMISIPELKTGMFVKTVYYNEHNKQFEFNSAYGDGLLGVIIDKNIIYSNGQHDYINNVTQQYIAEIYKEECFNLCNYPVWRHPEYQKYLDKKATIKD